MSVSRDPTEWQRRIAEAKQDEKIPICEEALKIWPAATEIWLVILQHADDVGEALARCLPLSVDPKLYEMYIEYIKKSKPEELGAAFEFVLDAVSFHPNSGSLWKAYIDWLAVQPVANDWEETFRRDKVRKAYKRAVTLPLANIEALWRSYGQFENRISRVSARKFIDERSAAYMKARSAYHTYQTLTNSLIETTMPSPEIAEADAPRWREYIEWERSNPLELESDDKVLKKRINFSFRRVTQYARWSSMIWFYAGVIDGPHFWEEGTQALPESCLLTFKLSEHYELQDDFQQCETVLNRLIEHRLAAAENSTPGWVQLVKCTHRMQGLEKARDVIVRCMEKVEQPTSDLYVAAAYLERSSGNEAAEDAVWDFAFSMFGESDISLVLKYLEYLFSKRDLRNARSVFEQTVQNPLLATQQLWDKMLKLEAKHAQEACTSLKPLRQLEKRYEEQFKGTDDVELFMRRFGEDAFKLFGVKTPTPLPVPIGTVPLGTTSTPTPAPRSTSATPVPPTIMPPISNTSSKASPVVPLPFPPEGPLCGLLAMLPPANFYDGPLIDNQLLMQFVANVNI